MTEENSSESSGSGGSNDRQDPSSGTGSDTAMQAMIKRRRQNTSDYAQEQSQTHPQPRTYAPQKRSDGNEKAGKF